ncbi:hypothetical protein FACS189445_4090 [Spirochaetia bacterium]|nr:hypothetical protein FACS189445_4090 [Spirochaetia bacterium]
MDARKISIREQEDARRETQRTRKGMVEQLGETLLARLDRSDGDVFPSELGEYRRILGEIAGAEAKIRAIEADILRLKELEGEITEKEQDNAEKTKELWAVYTRLGETLLAEAAEADFAAPFKGQAETLTEKIRSQEDRLRELEEGKHGTIFTWIGNNTQGLMVRASAAKNRTALQRLYTAAGEKFASRYEQAPADFQHNHPNESLPDQALTIRRELAELGESLTLLRDERRKTQAALGQDSPGVKAGPSLQTRDLRRQIALEGEQLRCLYARFGDRFDDQSAGTVTESDENGGPGVEVSLLSDEDKTALARIRELRGDIAEYDLKIEKLKAAIRIDEARATIAKIEKTIAGHRQRIAAGEEAIAALEKRIEEAKGHIEEWMAI